MPPAGDGFRRQATRKGTIKLKTLRKPGVKEISTFFNKAGSLGTHAAARLHHANEEVARSYSLARFARR